MPLDADILAIPNLISYWKLTDRTGTNAPDSGPANMPITLVDPADGVPLTTGGGNALRGNGTTTRGITASLPAAHALRFTANAPFTIGGWFSPRTAFASGTRGIFGRSSEQFVRVANTGFVIAQGASTSLTPFHSLTLDQPAFLAVTWDGVELSYFINGSLVNSVLRAPTNFNTTSGFEVLTIGNNPSNCTQGDIERVFAVGRAMGQGELRALYLAASLAPITTGDTMFDDQSVVPLALRGTATARCAGCGGLTRAVGGKIVSGASTHDVTCYGAKRSNITGVVPSITTPTMTASDIGIAAARTTYDILDSMARQFLPTKTQYHNGTTWVVNTGVTKMQELMAIPAAAAALHVLGGNSTQESWLLRIAVKTMNEAMATQAANTVGAHRGSYGDAGSTMTALGWGYLMEAYLWLGDRLGAGTRAQWKQSFITAGEYWVRTEKNYYVNGNIEAAELLNLYLLYKVTGDAQWLAEYEYQLVALANPAPTMGNQTGVNAGQFGWRWGVPPTQADGSDGQGWFQEGKNNSVDAPGFDGIYTEVQLSFLLRLHWWSNDARLVPYINGMHNKMISITNTTGVGYVVNSVTIEPWMYDGRGGSRNNATRIMRAHSVPYLLQRPSLRAVNPITSTWPGSLWAAADADIRGQRYTYGLHLRALGEQFAPWIVTSPIWTP